MVRRTIVRTITKACNTLSNCNVSCAPSCFDKKQVRRFSGLGAKYARMASRPKTAFVPTVNTQTRRFSGPQQEPEIIDIDVTPNVATETWQIIASELAHQLPDADEKLRPKMEFAVKYAEMMARCYPNRRVKKGPTQREAGQMDQIASVVDNAGYKQGNELHYRMVQGYDTKREYYQECTLYGPFGTEDAPVYVPAIGTHRFVACCGGYNGVEEHDLVWFCVRQGPKHRCPLCGQIFQLVTSDTSHRDHPLHDPEIDYKQWQFQKMSAH